jgi:hypothetical protein
LLLVLKRSAQQDADLEQFLGQAQDRNSPGYHKWLTPTQFAERFGASSADVETLTAWLQSRGFTVNSVGAGRATIEFSGTAGQLQQAFHTELHRFVVDGEEHIANVSDPKIPAALAPVVGGLLGLNDFFPKAQRSAPISAAYDRAKHTATPEFTTSSGGKLLYVGPVDAATIYNTPNPLNVNFKGSQSYTGHGVTIAVISDANIDTAEVDTYRSFFGLPANTPKVVIDGNDPGVDSSATGHSQQALMNVEVAGALAPNARVVLYAAKNTALASGLYLAMARAMNDNLADIVQLGFSRCEAELANSGNIFVRNLWSQAAVQGVTVVVAAGDGGAAGCDVPQNETSAKNGFGVNGFASTNFNIAVGGTDYDTLPEKFGDFVGAKGTAAGYIPESPWNNSVALGGNGALADNTAFKDKEGLTNILAGGGGASSCIGGLTGGATCQPSSLGNTYGYNKPSWQTDAGNLNIPRDGVRDVPDVSLLAGNGQYGATWAVCGNEFNSGGSPVADCSGESARIQGMGGTSAAASAFAGILALVGESQGNRLGQADYALYSLANQTALYNTIFHDLKAGNNSVVCASGSLNCGTNGFLTAYDAGTGYDQASGLGSVDASALISNWGRAVFASTTTTLTVNGGTAPISVTHGTSLTFKITVSGSGYGTPTGLAGVVADVDETSGTYGDDVGFAGNLSGVGTFTQVVPDAPGGTFNVWGRYDGDVDYSASQSEPVQLTISKENSTVGLALYYRDKSGTHQVTSAGTTYPLGTYVAVDATPRGLSNTGVATGTVTFDDNRTALPSAPNNLNNRGYAEAPVYYWSGGSHSITASYGGDNSFHPSATTSAVTFNISQVGTGMTVAVTPTALIGGTATMTGTVTPAAVNAGAAPSGTITLIDSTNGAALGSATLRAATDPATGGSMATFTLTFRASLLRLGANTLAATYPGDASYTGASAATSITRLPTIATAVTLLANPASLISGTTIVSGEVTPVSNSVASAPTGTITLTDKSSGASLGTASLTAGKDAVTGEPIGTFSLTVNAASLSLGANSLTASYPGDANFSPSSGSTTATRLAKVSTGVTLTANPVSLLTGTTLLSGRVSPAVTNAAAPSGSVKLINERTGNSLGDAELIAGTDATTGGSIATFSLTVKAASLLVGANTISAAYSGDANYTASTGTTIVTLNAGSTTNSEFGITATNLAIKKPGETTGNTSTITVTPKDGFTGKVNLTAALLTSPADAVAPPTLSFSAPSVTISGTAPATATATIATTALTYASLRPEQSAPGDRRWYEGGGAALACVLLLGIPARRRGWKAMLGLLLFAFVGLSVGCGVKLNKVNTERTTAGTYVFTVTGVDAATGAYSATGTITVTVE